MTRELPVLDESRCIGCGLCVDLCPVDCLERAEIALVSIPWLPRPMACISCSVCEVVCPTDAIRLIPTR